MPNQEILLEQQLFIKNINVLESKIIKFYDNFLIQISPKKQFQKTMFRIMKYETDILMEICKTNQFSQDYSMLIFELNSDKQIYYVQEKLKMERIRMLLKQKLNQKKFHDYYKPRKKIGSGNFASVYLVQRLIDKKNFAAKIFHKETNYVKKRDRDNVQNQIKIMRQLNHKNVIHLEEVFESETTIFIVMQLLDEGRLYDLTKIHHKFKNTQIKIILKNLLNGLQYLQRKNIIHRDLKPENILFRNKEKLECVIVDFGLSTYADSEYIYLRCGTPGYTSPEIINVKDTKTKFTPVSDLFSLGTIFYELFIGKRIFDGQTKNQVLKKNKEAKFDFLEFSKKFGRVEFDLLDLMLKKNPILRIHAIDALKHQYLKNISENIIFSDQEIIEDENPNLSSKMMMANKIPKICMKQLNQTSKTEDLIQKKSYSNFDSIGSYKMIQYIYYGNTNKTTDSSIVISSSQFRIPDSDHKASKIFLKISRFNQNGINNKRYYTS